MNEISIEKNKDIYEFIAESKPLLIDIVKSERNFISTICTISAAISAFSIPLFTLAINHLLLLIAIAFFLLNIIIGAGYLAIILRYDNIRLTSMLNAVFKLKDAKTEDEIRRALEEGMSLSQDPNKKKNGIYCLGVMTVFLSLGIITFFATLLLGVLY
ncbi:MAG: hypothetical protein ABIA67_04300 [Candidatus Margulisiibacteriota bacterium]